MTTENLTGAMESDTALGYAIHDGPQTLLDGLIAADHISLSAIIGFLVDNDLLEIF